MAIRYLTLSELIYINGMVLNRPDIVAGTQQIRDIQLLDAAVARPAASAFGEDAYPTLREKAAALLHSVTRNHPFTDGNKRTATVGVVFMFLVNGFSVVWDRDDALTMIVRVAEGQAKLDEVAEWFPLRENTLTPSSRSPLPPSPAQTIEEITPMPPDEEADVRLIAGIIEEQRWLLNQLERR